MGNNSSKQKNNLTYLQRLSLTMSFLPTIIKSETTSIVTTPSPVISCKQSSVIPQANKISILSLSVNLILRVISKYLRY